MQSIESSVVHLKKVRSYNDSNGFVNFFNITGQLKSIDLPNNRIEVLLSNKNPDYAIEIEFDAARFPSKFRVGDMVTCSGFCRGSSDGNAWLIRFRGKEINDPKLTELSGDALDDLIRRMNLPFMADGPRERLSTQEYRRAKGARRNGNYIGLSGFVENIKYYPGKVRENGQKGPDSVKMLLRQFEDVALSVMVELNGSEAERTYKGIVRLARKGFPFVRFHGEAYVKIKDEQVEVPLLDGEGKPILDAEGKPKVEIQAIRTVNPAIKAIASVDFGKPHHCRQPKVIKDEETGEERTVYPYPWAAEYLERAEAHAQKQRA